MNLKFLALLILFELTAVVCKAQTKYISDKDITDMYSKYVLHKKTNDSSKIDTELKDGKITFTLLPAVGYSLTTKFAINLASNIVFKFKNANVSSFVMAPTLTSRKQIMLPIRGSIWTKNNAYNMVSDIRVMKYPQSTYGLGENSALSNECPMDYYYFRFYETIYKKIKGHSLMGLGLHFDQHWDIETTLAPNLSEKSLYYLGLPSKTRSAGISLNYLYDNRESSIFPIGGLYFNANLRHNSKLLSSDYTATTLVMDTRKYIRLSKTKENILAFWNLNWLTLKGNLPYLDLPSTGWDMYNNTARGYIQGRFRGYNFLYGETEYRFQLTKNKLWGGVVFANVQSFSKTNDFVFAKINPGGGVGLRLKINKLSQTNLAIDYGFGANGSRGLFLNIGEVF